MKKISVITGRAVPLRGNDIDTDRIIPARFLKEITFGKMGEYPFYDERFHSDGRPKDHPFNTFTGASILFANANFGCGSSREHAPQSLLRWGIQAIVAESFAEIFAGNCTMLGIPVVCASEQDIGRAQELAEKNPTQEFSLNLSEGNLLAVSPPSQSSLFHIDVSIAETRRKALMEGTWDSTAILLGNAEKVRALESGLPKFARRTTY